MASSFVSDEAETWWVVSEKPDTRVGLGEFAGRWGFVEVIYGALVVGDLSPGETEEGVSLVVVGLKRDHLGEVVYGADVVSNAVLVVGAALQDFI